MKYIQAPYHLYIFSRCELGHSFLLEKTDIMKMVNDFKNSSLMSDEFIVLELRRLELALEPGGWRGKVDEQIGKELLERRSQGL